MRAAKLANNADADIACIGNDPMIVAREMYDRKTLSLPAHDSALAQAVYSANNKCVMAVVSSYPFSICEEQEYMPAIIYTTHAGPELGNAFADVILSLIHILNADYKLFIRQIKVHRDMAIRIIKIGLPTGIQNMVISFSNVLVQASVNSFGSDAVAGFGAYLKVDGFNILPVLSISMAVTTFVGQNYGANKPERVKKGMWTALGTVSYTHLSLSAAL